MPPKQTHEVDAFLEALEHPRKKDILTLRDVIRKCDKRIREEVKWNAPSFAIDDHFATFKLRPGDTVQVVLHTGAKAKSNAKRIAVDDDAALLTWPAQDRAVATFKTSADVKKHQAAFARIVKQWIAQTQG